MAVCAARAALLASPTTDTTNLPINRRSEHSACWQLAHTGMNLQGALVTTQAALAVAKQMERARLPAVSSGAAVAPTEAHNGNPAALLDTV